MRIAWSAVTTSTWTKIRTTASGKYASGAPDPTPTPSVDIKRMLLINRFALIAITRRAAKMSIGRTGARTSCSSSRPTKNVAITVGKPITSIRTESDVKPPVRIVSRVIGRKWPAAAPMVNAPPPMNTAAANKAIPSRASLPGPRLSRRCRHASSSALRMIWVADAVTAWGRAGAR